MKDVRVDAEGELRCWNCGMKGLLAKRTFRSKMLIGVGSLLTKKKLKCQTCGEYNDTGNAKPFDGPASRKWRKAWEKEQSRKSAAQLASEDRSAQAAARALVAEVAAAQASGFKFEDDDEDALSIQASPSAAPALAPPTAVPPPPPPSVPPGWRPDPTGRNELRYWDGSTWTDHVSSGGAQGADPMP
jgi:hypothetical protein